MARGTEWQTEAGACGSGFLPSILCVSRRKIKGPAERGQRGKEVGESEKVSIEAAVRTDHSLDRPDSQKRGIWGSRVISSHPLLESFLPQVLLHPDNRECTSSQGSPWGQLLPGSFWGSNLSFCSTTLALTHMSRGQPQRVSRVSLLFLPGPISRAASLLGVGTGAREHGP